MSAQVPAQGVHAEEPGGQSPPAAVASASGAGAPARSFRHSPESLWLTAAVAGLFSAVVGALLLLNVARSVPDPLSTPTYADRKQVLRQRPEDDAVKQEIRRLDQTLREDYFRRQRFTAWGAYLLLAGVVVAVAAAKAAATLRRRLPQPRVASWQEVDTIQARQGLWSVAALAVLLLASAVLVGRFYRSVLPRDARELAAAAFEVAGRGAAVAQADSQRPPAAAAGGPGAAAEKKSAAGAGVEKKPEAVPAPAVAEKGAPPAPATPGKVPEVAAAAAEDRSNNWTRFRGPFGSGISPAPDMPTTWDAPSGKGIVWKAAVPLPGNNSPILWKDRVFLTGATEERREAYCFEAPTGKLLWKAELPPSPPGTEPPKVMEDTGFAAPTGATDGVRFYALFANGDLVALDLDGKLAWLRRLGVPKNPYGHASSLVCYADRLFVQLDQGPRDERLSRLLALDPSDGRTAWEVVREVPSCWSTPLMVEHEGQPQLIACGDPWVIAYDARDGKEIWRSKSLRQDIGPSPVAGKGFVVVASEFPGIAVIRLGGQGDVTESHVAWTADVAAPDTCSPLLAGDLLLVLASYGTLACYDVGTGGDPLWEEDLQENFRSSPGLAGDKVYLFAETGKSFVVKPSREKCERIAEGNLGEECVTSPAFQHGRIYIRGKEHLFCLGEK